MEQSLNAPVEMPIRAGSRTGRLRRVAVVIGLLASAGLVWQSSQATFNATTDNPGNSWEAGAVQLNADPSVAVFTAAAKIKPDDPEVQCIEVTYQGSLATAGVQLYTDNLTESVGGVLDTQLMMNIRIGDANDTCAAQGAATWADLTTLVTGDSIASLATYEAWGDALLTGWSPNAAGQMRAFQFTSVLPTSGAVDDAQGDTVTIDFVWETRNS
jgi:hypothetical protein